MTGDSFIAQSSFRDAETRARRVLEAQNLVLERVAAGAPLSEILELLTCSSEDLMPEMLCSVLLLDRDTQTLHHGSAPSLPDAYCKAVDGLLIGPNVGSCGAAAYWGQRVVAEDVRTHPNWTEARESAERAGLRACWSEPIFSTQREVLGTFAMYYREPRHPTAADLEFIRTSAHIAGVAIERARTERELNHYRERLEELVRERTQELEYANRDLCFALQDVKVLRGMLPICAWCKRIRDDRGYWAQLEKYIGDRSEAVFTHGLCPHCETELNAEITSS